MLLAKRGRAPDPERTKPEVSAIETQGDRRLRELRGALVDELRRKGTLRSRRVAEAFARVPRHLFVPDVAPDAVYADRVLPLKHEGGELVSSSSQPSIMAIMLEQLDPQPGERVLEVGTGSGYNAALLGQLVGEAGRVVSLDIDPDLVAGAREHLDGLGVTNVEVHCADGADGYSDAAPYDRIVLTAGAADIAPAWWAQLAACGRLLLPFKIRTAYDQASIAFQRRGDRLESVSVSPCLFMGLRGAMAGTERAVTLEAGLRLATERLHDVSAVRRWLRGPRRRWPARVAPRSPDALALWLALHEPGFCYLLLEDGAEAPVPVLSQWGTSRATFGLLDAEGLCALGPPGQPPAARVPTPLSVHGFGLHDGLARHLIERLVNWDGIGQPGWRALYARAYPEDASPDVGPGEVVLRKRWSRFVFGWDTG